MRPNRPERPPLDPLAYRATLSRALREWVRPHWRPIAVSIGLMTLLASTTGAYPIIIKYSYDTLSSGDMSFLWIILVGIVGVTLLRGTVDYFQGTTSQAVTLLIGHNLQKMIYAHLIASDYPKLTQETPGHLISHISYDAGLVRSTLQLAMQSVIRDTLTIIALVCSMIWLDWVLSLVVLCIYPLAFWPVRATGRRMRELSRKAGTQAGDTSSALIENFSGIRLLKTYRLEDYSKRQITYLFDRAYKLQMKSLRARAMLNPTLEVLGGMAVAGVIGFAGWRISSGQQTVGDFTGFVSALLMAAQPVRGLGNLGVKLQEGLAAADHIFQLTDDKPHIVDSPGAQPLRVSAGEITFENVTFAYDGGGGEAVSAVSLVVPGGETVALVGRSGAGKSTLFNLVPRLYEVSAGSILIDRQNVREVTLDSLRDAMAIVAQDVTLFNDTVAANIALGRLGAPHDEIEAAAKDAAAHEFIMALPLGYDTIIGDRGLRLSGGQRQRLALARAILRDAPILLLDEATSALDADSERQVQDALARFSRNRTTLVIAHRLSTVQNANRIVVMEAGRIAETGTHAELMLKDGIYAGFCRSQLLSDTPRTDTEPAIPAEAAE